ncbi:MAG: lycopene beta-cyclase CrtY [Sphingobium sp.]|uniref:lycopene beta-cyclase CrtY n=1 Tax=Sphingobium sp. TaxID=1912891 RepID=UPI0029A35A4D|nr:lycopene beta-cyclase CrtY [Sphingobium sp.]MDX3911748.1 lycopene beta-cyclase CrtY [Sphingobium sp.]
MSSQPATNSLSCDLAIVGGGLAGGLVALAIAERHPSVRILLIEREGTMGGNHVWSFFDGDVEDANRWLVDPLIAHRWADGHEVRFPGYHRTLPTPYNSITSARFDTHLQNMLGDRIVRGKAVRLTPDAVMLEDGREIAAKCVMDARGGGDVSVLECGWQKFVGQTLRLSAPHGLTRPIIMDATVAQIDGYRFVYLLPTGEREIFVEDTYYSDGLELAVEAIRTRIGEYAKAQGWVIERVVHEETGVLPVVHGGDFDALWPSADPMARAGVRGGLFHPMTGYSLPDAVAFALHMAERWPLEGDSLANESRTWAKRHWASGGYYRLLGKMLFRAADPASRYRIFQRFYRLPPALIQRFYAGRSTLADKARILCGRPPVPISRALKALMRQG